MVCGYSNKNLKNKMENNATEVIKNYTVEKMAQWHYEQLSKFKKFLSNLQ